MSYLRKITNKTASLKLRGLVSLFLFIIISISACSKNEVDLRKLAPKDTIIYLETNDLGNALNALTDNDSFKQKSTSKTDFSAIEGIQVAVAISGFETSENQVTQEQSVLNFKPKFTAIAETHAWGWQVNALVENNLNAFIRRAYGNDAKLERKSVNNTERFTWTASDGRKTYAVISASQVFFGNDEESINKCLAAKRGEAESLLKSENLSFEYEKAKGKLAFGFISNEGIKQIADLVGVSVAVGQTESANARGFIARILPQILNNSTREITWTAEKKEKRIEDMIFIKTEKEVSNVLNETLVPANKNIKEFDLFLPSNSFSVTRYNLKNPQVAFRSILLLTAKNTDAVNAKIISAFSNSLLSQYGVADAETFLSAVESEILTAKIAEDTSVAIVKAKDLEKLKTTFFDDFKPESNDDENVEVWISEENKLSIAFNKDILILGDSEGVAKCLSVWKQHKISPPEADPAFGALLKSNASTATITEDTEITENIVKVLGKTNDKKVNSKILTETRFNKQGIERRYFSDFGFLGTIIEQFANA